MSVIIAVSTMKIIAFELWFLVFDAPLISRSRCNSIEDKWICPVSVCKTRKEEGNALLQFQEEIVHLIFVSYKC